MNIHAIGWGILAMIITMFMVDFIAGIIYGYSGKKYSLAGGKLFGILVGLAVTLITW